MYVCGEHQSLFQDGLLLGSIIRDHATGERTSHFAEYTTPAEEMSPVAVCVSPTFDINQGLDHSVL